MTYPIFSLSGPAGSGKSTVANILSEEFGGQQVAFSDPMKELAVKFFPYENVYGGSEMRNKPVKTTLVCGLFEDLIELFGESEHCSWWYDNMVEYEYKHGGMSARHFLQQLGTELGRKIGADVWLDKGLESAKEKLLKGAPFVILTDARFRNEIMGVKQLGGVTCLVKGTGIQTTNDSHASEAQLKDIPEFWFDHRIHNNKSWGMDTLRKSVVEYFSPQRIF